MGKICDQCKRGAQHSDEWVISKALAEKNKKLQAVLVVAVVCWVLTVSIFLWHHESHNPGTPTDTIGAECYEVERNAILQR